MSNKPLNVIVNFPDEEKKSQKKNNKIQVIGLLVNIILGLLTFSLFLKTVEANKISADALELNKETLSETKKQFDSQNIPYLQCKDFYLDTINAKHQFTVEYKIENIGNSPVQVLERKGKTKLFFDSSVDSTTKLEPMRGHNHFYVSKETPMLVKDNIFDPDQEIKYGSHWCYKYLGEILYINPLTQKKRVCIFGVEICSPPSKDFKILYIINRDVIEKKPPPVRVI